MNRISQYSPELNLGWVQPRDTKDILRSARRTRAATNWNVDFKNGPDREFAQNLAGHLIQQLSKRSRESDGLRKQVEQLTQQVARHEHLLSELLGSGSTPPLGHFEEWVSVAENVEKFAGMHVAFLPGRGVIASGDSFDTVFQTVQGTDSAEQITFGFVPAPTA